ncbi:SEC-C metal-binding domain-containing protein [Bacillus thermotolerans]|uniref:SEC-C metal-binding domain-containing protein n=1 Tax=Bacillus thermotolerans TaxID=1221996 RepID=UPI000588EC6B|nr:SEC-C metal-binding domain-containing protein [Bacillus thermotolerans]KKB42098.1 hypothetical protein QY96_01572 [Bacillus thermotolerans]
MPLIGRNEKCYCGSGKKYKKCCLSKDEEMSGNQTIHTKSSSFSIAHTTHDVAFGIKELALAQLEQINIYLSREHILDSHIKFNLQDILSLVDSQNMVERYLQVMKESMIAKGMPNIPLELVNLRERANTRPSLNNNEKKILRTVAQSNLNEYFMLSDFQTVDYGAMRVLNEFAYKTVKEGVSDDKNIFLIQLIVDTDDKLVDWIFVDGIDDEDEKLDHEDVEFIWKPLDDLYDKYQQITHELHGLEEDSKIQLVTALHQEDLLPVEYRDRISYNGLTSHYTGILEQELGLLIAMNEGKRKDSTVMMKRINDYLKVKTLPYLSDNFSDLYERLEEIRTIRNQAAHGGRISYEQFLKVKQFMVSERALAFISWAKIDFEDK